MALWLMKTEPGEYSFEDLRREKTTLWTGVSNAAALAHLRAIRAGDRVLIYHTGDEKAIVGLAEAVSGPREDPQRPGLNAKGEPKAAVVELAAVKPAKTPVTLAAMKADARFKDWALVKQPRLSVMPVPAEVAKVVMKLAGL